jgi:hypothetical protein
MEPRNRFSGINSASLCSLAGRYDIPLPTRCLAPIDFLKMPALHRLSELIPWNRFLGSLKFKNSGSGFPSSFPPQSRPSLPSLVLPSPISSFPSHAASSFPPPSLKFLPSSFLEVPSQSRTSLPISFLSSQISS